jgi:ADP-ribosylglycohydrolase
MNNILYGIIYGDMAGSTYERHPVKDYHFELFPENSHFTDDTVMTLAIATWLMNNVKDSNILIKSMQFFGSLYPQVGYGRNFFNWLKDPNSQPYYSWGNGSAMRVAPCAWVAKSLEEAEDLAKKSAEVTHNHPEGIKGAQAVAAAIYMARKGASKKEISDYITTTYGYNLTRTISEIKSMGYKFDVSCAGSVPEAITAFLESNDFEEAIRLAIYLGGDADTQAAIAGSIAEAFYGISDEIVEKVKSRLDKHLIRTIEIFNHLYNE